MGGRSPGNARLALLGVVLAIPALALGLWVYEPDRSITYGGRTYLDPNTISAAVVAREFAPLRDMRTQRRGKDLLIPEPQLRTGGDPTIVLLRRDDGRYEIYGLSGGP